MIKDKLPYIIAHNHHNTEKSGVIDPDAAGCYETAMKAHRKATLMMTAAAVLAGVVFMALTLKDKPGPAKTITELMAAMNIAPIKEAVKAPDFKVKDLDGQSVRLSDFSGQVVLLNFWTTW